MTCDLCPALLTVTAVHSAVLREVETFCAAEHQLECYARQSEAIKEETKLSFRETQRASACSLVPSRKD